MSESATAKPTAPEALEATDGHANDAEAAVDPTYGITREEAEELRMLIATERDGGDMAYAAFHSLCPTGEEYAFDDKACAIYRLLEKRGLIEGADAGNGFLFFGLTQNGRDASAAYDAAHAADDAQAGPFDAAHRIRQDRRDHERRDGGRGGPDRRHSGRVHRKRPVLNRSRADAAAHAPTRINAKKGAPEESGAPFL